EHCTRCCKSNSCTCFHLRDRWLLGSRNGFRLKAQFSGIGQRLLAWALGDLKFSCGRKLERLGLAVRRLKTTNFLSISKMRRPSLARILPSSMGRLPGARPVNSTSTSRIALYSSALLLPGGRFANSSRQSATEPAVALCPNLASSLATSLAASPRL